MTMGICEYFMIMTFSKASKSCKNEFFFNHINEFSKIIHFKEELLEPVQN
jgi:hypothetical protein